MKRLNRYSVHFASLLFTCLLCIPTKAVTSNDSIRNSLAGYLLNKEIPASLNATLSIRPVFQTHFNSTQDDTKGAFRFDYLMLNLRGDISDKLSYYYTQRLHEGNRASTVENLSKSINYAYIQYKFTPRLHTIVGKQAILYGGFEYYESPVDVFTYSTSNNYLSCYQIGLSLSYKANEQNELCAQITNNRTASMQETYGELPDNIKGSSVPLLYSAGWNGSFMNDKLQFRYAASAAEVAKDRWAFMIGGGQQINLHPVSLYLDVLYQRSSIDYLGAVRELYVNNEGIQGASGMQCVEYLTVVSKINFRLHSQWNIHLKGFYDQGSVYKEKGNIQKGKYLQCWCYEGGVEYYPLPKTDLYCFLNVSNKAYRQTNKSNIITPDRETNLKLGFVYRIPLI